MKKIIYYISIVITIISIINIIVYKNKKVDVDATKIVYITSSTTTTSASLAPYYSKYHVAGCDYILGEPCKVTLKYAKDNGYGACPKCEPTYRKLKSIDTSNKKIEIIEFFIMLYMYFIIPIYIYLFMNDYELSKAFIGIISILNSLVAFIINYIFIENYFEYNIIFAIIMCILNYILIATFNKQSKVYTTKIK